ncbi:MAG: pilus assembly protein PilM [Planctomycetes bacterium]|nr:pilus assembly protein PilM [Planctomycetota bacterium]
MGLGIDLGNSAVKVVALQRGLRGFVVTGVARRRIPRVGKPEERKPLLMKILHEALGDGGGRRVGVVGLSGRDINLQVVQQPAMKPANYRAMMGYELDQRREGDEQLYADFCTLREPDAYFKQYLAMVGVGKKPYVDERLEVARRAGVDVRDAVPNAFALCAAFRTAYGDAGGTHMVLDLGADNMDVALVRGGKLIYARNVSTGARIFDQNIAAAAGVGPDEAEWLKIRYGSILPASDNADPKEEEIRPAIRTAAGQLSGFIQSCVNHARVELGDRELSVDRILLSGGGARLRGLPEYLQSSLQQSPLKVPVELFDPFIAGVDASGVEAAGGEDFRSLPTEFAVPLGLAQLSLLPADKAMLSILPDAVKKRRDFFRAWSYVAAGAAALLVALLVITGFAAVRRASQTSRREGFEKQSSANLDRIAKLDRIEADQREVAARLDRIATATLASRALLDVHSEVRQFALKEEGIMLRELKIVDPSGDRTREGKGGRRCLFRHAEAGLVIGEIEDRTEDAFRVRMDFPPQAEPRIFPKGDCADLLEWEGDARVVLVVGEVSAESPGKANRILDEIKRRLTKEQRGQLARTSGLTDADRPGWRRFEIAVICQARYE